MSTRRLALFLGIAFIAIIAFFLLTSVGTTKAGEGTRAPGDYQGADNCDQGCHSPEYNGWGTTNHALVFDPSAAFFQQWSSSGEPSYCLPCHVVGYNLTSIGGYDPSLPWNDSYNLPPGSTYGLLGIQCENCHGPDTMSNPERANTSTQTDPLICTQCHYGARNPQYDDWNRSAHARTPPSYTQTLACAECHEAKLAGEYLSEGTVPTSLPDNPRWQLTCSTCHDPHSSDNEVQLRLPIQELCIACHNAEEAQPGDAVHHPEEEMRRGRANVPVPSSEWMSAVYCAQCHMWSYDYNASLSPNAVSGHEFIAKPEACIDCHDGTSAFLMNLEQAENSIESWQASTENYLHNARVIIDDAWISLNAADDLGFNEDTIDLATMYYDQANYSANFVDADGSMGAHNYPYASDLLSFAQMKAGQTITILTPGSFSGKVVDANGNALSGVQITRAGKTWATTGSDGLFFFMHAPGTFVFGLVQSGNEVGIVQASIMSGQTTDVRATVGAVPTDGGDGQPSAANETLQYVILFLLIIALIMMILLIMMQRKKPTVAEQKKETPIEKS